ncbi:MAG: glycerol-3-phosphate 1-O-acyltransferase PlsY [Candidatus Omnitrophota bacterium]|nr:MAG: glycerol-3-phosphate 1-O-acyltransferase PlsY [Candidatus Omnitrophota bacterium]
MIQFIAAIIIAYLIGSIPTSYIAGRVTKCIDIRQYGSGNVGATNTLRVLGKKMGAAVLLIDMAKGAFCVIVLPAIFFSNQLHISLPIFKSCIAAFVILGHIWTIFLKFKGGKGVATTCGVFLSLSTIPAIIAILIWFLTVIISKYVSLSSLIMMVSLPFLILIFKQPRAYLILSITLCILISYTHRSNIKRLIYGQENKIIKNKPKGLTKSHL